MLSSIGQFTGIKPALSSSQVQPVAPAHAAKDTSTAPSKPEGGAGTSESPSEAPSAKASAPASEKAATAALGVSGSNGVAPVKSASTYSARAYGTSGGNGADADRAASLATQRAMFRSQLIDKIGSAPEPSAKVETAKVDNAAAPNPYLPASQAAAGRELDLAY